MREASGLVVDLDKFIRARFDGLNDLIHRIRAALEDRVSDATRIERDRLG